jgi:hypothetical protein
VPLLSQNTQRHKTTLVLFLFGVWLEKELACKGLCYAFYLGGKILAFRSFGGKIYIGGRQPLHLWWGCQKPRQSDVKGVSKTVAKPPKQEKRKEARKQNKKNIISIMIAERIANREWKMSKRERLSHDGNGERKTLRMC